MPHSMPRAAPGRASLASHAAGSRGLLSSSGENREILGVVGKAPDHLRALLRRERPVEVHDKLPQVLVPALVLANELLGAARLRPGKHLGEAPAELLRLVLLPERRDQIALPALPVLETQRDVALVGKREALDAGLLLRAQLARKIAKALEHALQLTTPSLLVVGREEFLREFFVVLGELAFERRELRGGERRENRCRVLGRFRREPAVAQAHVGEPPGDVLRRDALGRALTGAA